MKLEMSHVDCGYGTRRVVRDFNASVQSGEIFCLLGPNGVGKTTLFKTILGFLPLMNGTICVDGKSLRNLPRHEHARILAYVPQAHVPPFAFTVFDVVLMGRTAYQGTFGSPGSKDKKIAGEAIERLGIQELADRSFTTLSGGERQMVLIARAVAQGSAFLMMDEPTSNLDFGNQVKVLHTVIRLATEGLGIIMTTHFPDHVFQCGGQVTMMQKQHKYASGPAAEVVTAENLFRTYGIPVAIVDSVYNGKTERFCRPVLQPFSGPE